MGGLPHEGLATKVGGMIAASNADISQPFYTFRAGGQPTSHHNKATSERLLGVELDWGIEYSHALRKAMVRGKFEGGHLWLSEDLAGEGSNRVDLLMLTASLGY